MKPCGLLRVLLVSACVCACEKRTRSKTHTPPLFEALSDFAFPKIEKLDSADFDQDLPVCEAAARAEFLKKGMTRREVLLLLGRPAMMGRDHWLYLPQEDGATVLPTATPSGSLEVDFEGNRLDCWSAGAVTFGVGGGDGGSHD